MVYLNIYIPPYNCSVTPDQMRRVVVSCALNTFEADQLPEVNNNNSFICMTITYYSIAKAYNSTKKNLITII